MSFEARTQNEKKLYEPIKNHLEMVFASYIDKPKKPVYQSRLSVDQPKYLYLEIVGDNKSYSEELKKEFMSNTLNIINNEGIYPDIVGYVQKKPSSQKEIIAVEIKDVPIKLRHVAQTKYYQDIFNASFGLLISSKGIPEENVRFVLRNETLKGKVIIMKYNENPYERGFFEIHSRFKDVPEPFKRFQKS